MKLCAVPDCPALAEGRKDTCRLHAIARTAEALSISKTSSGRGGKRCLLCRRVFKPSDYVLSQMLPRVKTGKSPGDAYGYSHVACDPPTARLSKRKIRESEKPLLRTLES